MKAKYNGATRFELAEKVRIGKGSFDSKGIRIKCGRASKSMRSR